MSDSKAYFDSLIQQGYDENQADQYTKQHFPEFELENKATTVVPQEIINQNSTRTPLNMTPKTRP